MSRSKVLSALVALIGLVGSFGFAPAASATTAYTWSHLDSGSHGLTDMYPLHKAGNYIYFTGSNNQDQNNENWNIYAYDGTTLTPTMPAGPTYHGYGIYGSFDGLLGAEAQGDGSSNDANPGYSTTFTINGTTATPHSNNPQDASFFPYGLNDGNTIAGFGAGAPYDGAQNVLYKVTDNSITEVTTGSDHYYGPTMLAQVGSKVYFAAGSHSHLYVIDTANNDSITQVTSNLFGQSAMRGFPEASNAVVFGGDLYFVSTATEADTTSDSNADGYSVFKVNGDGVLKLTGVGAVANTIAINSPYGVLLRVINGHLFLINQNTQTWNNQIVEITSSAAWVSVPDIGSINTWTTTMFQGKLYFYTQQSSIDKVDSFDGTEVLTIASDADQSGGTYIESSGGLVGYNGRLYYTGASQTGSNNPHPLMAYTPGLNGTLGTTELIEGSDNSVYELDHAQILGGKLYVPSTDQTDGSTNGYRYIGVLDYAAPVSIDVDDPTLSTIPDETITQDLATSGTVTYSDGSGIIIDSKGRLVFKVKSKFLVQAKGSVKLVYGAKTWKCTIKTFGSKKKLSTTLTVAKTYKSPVKGACTIPKAARTYMKTHLVTMTVTIKATRYATRTAKTKTAAGVTIKPVTRKMIAILGHAA